jgi:uracil phosphoribosyltransferase/phosphoserine phosphatase/adenylate kinase
MSGNGKNGPGSMPGPKTNPQLKPVAVPQSQSISKPTVVGIYGIQGTGKTYLLGQLKEALGEEKFAYHDGSAMITELVGGNFDAFKKLDVEGKKRLRGLAIETIGKRAAESGKVALVAGHLMFWSEGKKAEEVVWTEKDSKTYTHILCLDVPADLIHRRREKDEKARATGARPTESVEHLLKWQQAEQTQLRDLCRNQDILFTVVSEDLKTSKLLPSVLPLLRDFQQHNEKHNLSQAESKLDEAFLAGGKLKTMLVFDADKTLTAADTGSLFWKKAPGSLQSKGEDDPWTKLFSGPLKYTHNAFRQATLLYEEAANPKEYEALCQSVASEVTMYPEFLSLLQQAARQDHVGAVVITCGLGRVWEIVLEKQDLSKTVKVIGGGRLADGFVVTAAVKTALVARLRNTHSLYVWAFGDGPLDLGMLKEADQAIVVVGEEQARSKSMNSELRHAIDSEGLQARQVVLPSSASPRLDTVKLPLVRLTEKKFIDSVFYHHNRNAPINVIDATNKAAAKLLATSTRNASISGPSLRDAHHRVGWYLAVEFLTQLIGIKKYEIPHVQGKKTDGYRLLNEEKTSIVALMRGGEPIAFGVNEAFPLAMFVHAKPPVDIMPHHLSEGGTVVLVDSVVNSGKSIVEFVNRIRHLDATIPIVVVAGVVQAQSLPYLAHALPSLENFSIVTLRLSDNKFTGTGTVDTGNRLFNTTHLA